MRWAAHSNSTFVRPGHLLGATLACLAIAGSAPAQDPGAASEQDQYEELDTVVVVGEQSPPLWKLSKKGSVLWILGTPRQYLRNARFDSQRLHQLIASAQQVVLPGNVVFASPTVNLLFAAAKSDRNPGSLLLQDLMTPEAHASWQALKLKYSDNAGSELPGPKFVWETNKWLVMTTPFHGGDEIESMRPTFAWEGLRRAALRRSRLTGYDIEAAVSAIAAQHGTPVQKLRRSREFFLVRNPDTVIAALRAKKADAAAMLDAADYGDLDCLVDNLGLLEPEIDELESQARAWTRGDMAAYRSAGNGLQLRDCVREMVAAVSGGQLPGSPDAKQGQERFHRAISAGNRDAQRNWATAMQRAARNNKVTFSVVPIDRLLAEDGYLAALRDKGFLLEEPE